MCIRDSAPYARPARDLMRSLGIHADLIAVGPVDNTRDEAQHVARLCRERGWRRILLVTSPLHSRRASATFEHEGLEVIASPCTETRYNIETLGAPSDRLMAFGSVAHERLGLWVYAHRGWVAR